jgi:hypothetical protein
VLGSKTLPPSQAIHAAPFQFNPDGQMQLLVFESKTLPPSQAAIHETPFQFNPSGQIQFLVLES